MSIQNKPDYKVFASDAKSGEIETFPDILRGWGVTIDRTGEIPPMEWFNAIGKRVDEWLLYLTQRGIPEWDSSLDYPKTAITQFNNVFYISTKATKGEQPDRSQASWSTLSAFLGLGNYYSKTESDSRFQPKGSYAPAGDYATNSALTSGLAGKQPAGNYANGDLFYKTGNYAGMRPENLKYAATLYDDGRFAIWGEDERRFLWRFNNKGEMTDGLIPLNCGGTGARTASDARTNLSVHSKDEVNTALAGKQPTGNYANSDIFYNTASLVGMRTASKNYALVNFENGDMGGWDESTKSFTFRFDKLGKLINGTVPASLVTGLAQIGVGQIWQDVKNSRAANTSYTNDTGKPILVNIGGTYLTGSNSSLLLVVSGITVAGMSGNIAATVPIFTSAIVPAGATYRVNITGTTASIWSWAELR